MTFPGLRLPVILLILLGIPFLWLLWVALYAISPGPSSNAEQVEVFIPASTSLTGIKKILADNKVVHHDPRFSMLARLTGAASKLKAGEYSFVPGSNPLEVIEQLKKGKVLYRPVTIPEGTELLKVADILANGGWVDRHHFAGLAVDAEFLQKLGVEADSLEGYLFPDTYYLSKGQQDDEAIIAMMVARHFAIFDDLMQDAVSNDPGLTHNEIVTLASIVEKETGLTEERPLVAGVFINRLQRGMRLQADPTVRYGLPQNKAQLTQADLKNNSPYNTYAIKGLPPGPIANPGRGALQAAITPAKTEYLYFVAKDDSSHHFSRTLKEHNEAVAKYRNKRQ